MLSIRDLKIDPASLGSTMLLVDVLPVYAYNSGVRSDTVTGFRYMVALPSHALEKLGVKIDGPCQMEKPTEFVSVVFTDLDVSVYESGGKVGITAKAASIRLADASGKVQCALSGRGGASFGPQPCPRYKGGEYYPPL